MGLNAGRGLRRVVAAVVATLVGASLLAACEAPKPANTLIAFLLASDQAHRWVNADEPAFAKRVKQTCKGCDYLTLNARGDAQQQAEQFQQALDEGADAIVLNAVDAELAEELVVAAGDVPVIAYDRFVAGADYFVSYDATATGTLQAQAVLAAAPAGRKPAVLLINGGSRDGNALAIKRARAAVLGTQVRVLDELEPETWAGDLAGAWVTAQLRKTRATEIDAILAGNDNQAAAVVEALRQANVPPKRFPLITGQDADLEAVRRIVRGEQALTVYKPINVEAAQAADIAVQLVTGGTVSGASEVEGVAAFVFTPQAVTIDNLTDTVVRDRLYSIAEICDTDTLADCERLGIS
ncbi:MAG: substrate-binding domain-containing protein [Nocardioides sp.]